jgi:integrase
VDLETGEVHIHQAVNDDGKLGPTKTGKARAVTVDGATLTMLREMPEEGERLFPIDSTWLSRVFQKTARRAGLLPMRLHELRHLAATMMLRAGVAVLLVSRRLGHAKVGITMDTYGHIAQDQDADAARRWLCSSDSALTWRISSMNWRVRLGTWLAATTLPGRVNTPSHELNAPSDGRLTELSS